MPYKNRERQLEAQRQHYRNNKQVYADKSKESRDKAHEYVYQHIKKHPCLVCGETDPIVLEFDHRNPDEKSFDICSGIQRRMSVRRLQSEIDKCDVLCSNCHRRKTAKQLGYFSYKRSLED